MDHDITTIRTDLLNLRVRVETLFRKKDISGPTVIEGGLRLEEDDSTFEDIGQKNITVTVEA